MYTVTEASSDGLVLFLLPQNFARDGVKLSRRAERTVLKKRSRKGSCINEKTKKKLTAYEIAELIIEAVVAISALITAIKWW